MAIATSATYDSALHAKLSSQTNIMTSLVATLVNPAYHLRTSDVSMKQDNRLGWNFICMATRLAVMSNAFLAISSLATNNRDNLEELTNIGMRTTQI